MKREILREAVKLNMERRRRKWWHRIVSGMAVLVVFATTYTLVLPAITMENDTICGMEDHTHSDACYYTPIQKIGRDLQCALTLHTHTESCYGMDGALSCGYADFVVHSHDSYCWDAEGIPVCSLTERYEHLHNELCYVTHEIYHCGMQNGEGSHFHSDVCYGEPELVCQLEETPEMGEELPSHLHDDACYGERQWICAQPEQEGHVNDESCGMETVSELCCGIEELFLHEHTEVCVNEEGILTCGMTQVMAHQHSEACMVDHTHTEACYQNNETEIIQICPYHVHETACYDESGCLACNQTILICNMIEHLHHTGCYPEIEDGLVEVRFEVPEEYADYYHSEVAFPATYTLNEGDTLAALENIPAVIVMNPDETAGVYQAEYHWICEDGFPVDETAEIQEDLCLTLKLYPVELPEAAKLVTATFMNGEEVLLTKSVYSGTIVSDLITQYLEQGLKELQDNHWRLEGWSYQTVDGTEQALIPEITAIETDTTYYAVFREYVSVTLHDIDSNGTEYLGSPLEIYVPVGDKLFSHSEFLLWDETPMASCLWYTKAGEPYALDTPVTEPIELYTYSYTLSMETKEVAEAAVEDQLMEEEQTELLSVPMLMSVLAAETNTFEEQPGDAAGESTLESVSIVKRRGEAITESDFLVDGVNYSDYQWEDADGNSVDPDNLVGTTLTSNYALTLAASTDYTITYSINVNVNSWSLFGNAPTVAGQSTLVDSYNSDDGNYTIRVPNPTQYMVTSGKYRDLYKFAGWKSTKTGDIISAGETVDAYWIQSNATSRTKNVELTAQWESIERKETVHYFVNLNCQLLDFEGNTVVPATGYFTDSVYSTVQSVNKEDVRTYWQGARNGGQYIVLQADDISKTNYIHNAIRNLMNGYDTTDVMYNGQSTWKPDYTGTKVFQVESVPSDEYVFTVIRNMIDNGTNISLNGKRITSQEMTSDNFAVRWYVFKYDEGDGWHIDGVLVAKQAFLTVKKTFEGDETAIQTVKEGYSITLDNTTNASSDIVLTLNPRANETSANRVGYTSYDAETDTYTWAAPVQRENYYTIRENNYILSDPMIQTSAVYTINNSDDSFSEWKTYPENGIPNIKGTTYADDVTHEGYKTVSIHNSYTKADTLTIHKIDKDTGNGLAGVSYRLTDSAGQPLELYQKPGVSYYSMKSEDLNNGFVQIADSVVTTDRNGSIYLKLENGTFTLEEAFPVGYGGVSRISVTVTTDRYGNVVFDEIISGDSTIQVEGSLVDKKSATLTIRNASYPTSVTARKVWTIASEAKPVTVALFRNGVDMGGSYHTVLNSANNWTYTWENLPLYVDGASANYSLREIKIGNTSYDPTADVDGYAEYMIAYDKMAYYKNSNRVTGPIWTDDSGVNQYADNIELVVRNEVYRGQTVFMKVDDQGQPLAGATFKLYSDAAQKNQVAVATSDEYGRVVFESLLPDTYYVMKETDTPKGYVGGDSLYKIHFSSLGRVTIEDTVTGESLNAIVNYLDDAPVVLRKTSQFGTLLPNAHFQLEIQENGVWNSVATGFTDSDGLLPLGELPSGNYRLTETLAPDGFMELPEPILFTIEQGTLTITNPNNLWSANMDDDSGTYLITVANETGYELPKTGGITPQVVTCSGVLLMLAALVKLNAKRKKGKSSL